MPTPEHHHSFPKASNEPLHPTPLPDTLAEFLKDHNQAALFHGTENLGTIVIAKAPADEIHRIAGRLPIEIRHELFSHPNAPVIRTVVALHDQPENPLRFEMFTNIGNQDQRDEFSALETQKTLHLLFYDENLDHRLSKQVRLTSPASIRHILTQADKEIRKIKPGHFDFDRAKQEVMARTRV